MLLSGGIDSATCLYEVRESYEVRALTLKYHGIAAREVWSAKAVVRAAGIFEHRFVRLPDLKEAGEISGGRFAGYPPAYIPMRNSIFYSFAASYAEEIGADVVVGGHNRDDARVFRDVSSRFFDNLQRAFWAGSKIMEARKTRLLRPLANKTKAEVVELAAKAGVPLELTWSCHRDGREHCWECQGCVGRMDSFKRAGVPDPLGRSRATKIT